MVLLLSPNWKFEQKMFKTSLVPAGFCQCVVWMFSVCTWVYSGLMASSQSPKHASVVNRRGCGIAFSLLDWQIFRKLQYI